MISIQRFALKKMQELSETFPVLAILGPRQVGKTTLVSQFVKTISKEFVWFDLELQADFEKLSQAELLLPGLADKCVVIDEVQLRPELFSLIRPLVDRQREPLRFILLGSAQPSVIKGVSESLAGRVAYYELKPFVWTEVKDIVLQPLHHFRGGFPESILAKKDTASINWLDAFIRGYLERDLQLLGIGATPQKLRQLWEMLAWQNGNLLNYSALGNSLGLSNHTIRQYIDYMEGTFLVSRLYPYHFNIKKRLVKSPKIYINDTGLLHRLLRIADYNQLFGTPMLGASWEGYVLAQINALKPKDVDLYFYRTQVGAEVDFVFTKSLKPVAVAECKFGSAPKVSKGMMICIDDLQTNSNFIINPTNDDYPSKHNICTCGLEIFLTKYLPCF